MSSHVREIANPRTGQRMRFLLTAADTDGALMRVETYNPPNAIAEPMHVHPRQETRAEVVSGTLRFVVGGRERLLGAGDTIVVPAGTPHRLWNDGDTEAVAFQEARPALRLTEFFETYFELAADGELDDHGRVAGGQPRVRAGKLMVGSVPADGGRARWRAVGCGMRCAGEADLNRPGPGQRNGRALVVRQGAPPGRWRAPWRQLARTTPFHGAGSASTLTPSCRAR